MGPQYAKAASAIAFLATAGTRIFAFTCSHVVAVRKFQIAAATRRGFAIKVVWRHRVAFLAAVCAARGCMSALTASATLVGTQIITISLAWRKREAHVVFSAATAAAQHSASQESAFVHLASAVRTVCARREHLPSPL
jgi:hypothetical protein